jgi:hypothetical protein
MWLSNLLGNGDEEMTKKSEKSGENLDKVWMNDI